MDENLKQIKSEVKQYKNTLVIDTNKVVMLLGYKVEPEDYYWHFETFGPNTKRYLGSCVGGFIPLLGYLNYKNYNQLLRIFKLNRSKK